MDKKFGKYLASDFVTTPIVDLLKLRNRVMASAGYATSQEMHDYVAAIDYAVAHYTELTRATPEARASADMNQYLIYAGVAVLLIYLVSR